MVDLVVLSGFSGSGKGAVLEQLIRLHPELKFIKSYTTRQKRTDKEIGNYHFVSEEVFSDLRDQVFFLECNQYAGGWYGTPINQIQACMKNGGIAVVEVDTNGHRQIINSLKDMEIKILSCFVVVDPDTIASRLLKRNTESLKKILIRLKESLIECDHICDYDLIVPNSEISVSVEHLEKAIFRNEYLKLDFNVEEYKNRMQQIIWLLED